MRSLSILGSTGSIGRSTLDVVAAHPEKFRVVALAEGHDVEFFAEQINIFKPSLVSVRDESSAKRLKEILMRSPLTPAGMTGFPRPEILFGVEGVTAVATHPEAQTVVSAIVGAAGLVPTCAAIAADKTIALANKETMVVAGSLVVKMAKERDVKIIPVDSEHSAIYQSLLGHRREDVSKIILTASGGPFLRSSPAELLKATPEAALKHPNWSMGAKITIDSATLLNKGLEVIEAKWLFDFGPDKINVVVHPQSIVHSMVEYCDGSVIAQLGMPDMRAPIAYAISYPGRVESGVKRLDLTRIEKLTFEAPDRERFPCLGLAYDALREGGSMPCVLNAAGEIAVAAFLKKKIGFMDIPRVIRKTMDAHKPKKFDSIEEILEIDRVARADATASLNTMSF